MSFTVDFFPLHFSADEPESLESIIFSSCLFSHFYPFLALIFPFSVQQFHNQLYVYRALQQSYTLYYVAHLFRLSFHRSLSLCLRPGFPRQPSLSPLVLPMEPPPPPPPPATAQRKTSQLPGGGQETAPLIYAHAAHEQTALDVFIPHVINVTEPHGKREIGRPKRKALTMRQSD